MPKWTSEQICAINESGTNIIVSAGAGSGKTAVLTERVITKLKSGISINNLLILTFTNNAAHEMKERIRKSIKKEAVNDDNLKKELDYIDNAYITTFDSFALSIVKKYHYLLNIDKELKVIDSSIIDLKKEEFLDSIFEDNYKNNNKEFLDLVNLLCVKDDKELKELILNINSKIDLILDKDLFFLDYEKKYYSDEFLDKIISDYEKLLKEKIDYIKKLMNDLEYEVDGKYYENFYNTLKPLFDSNSYDEIKRNSDIKIGMLRNATELGKEIKTNISNELKTINNMCYSNLDEIKYYLKDNKKYVMPIIDIIKELNKKILDFKKSINRYEFNDISLMAISLVKNNSEIKDALKYKFNEICIDEYQDTSDIQEYFINLISNNNLYMVGDIKQSIYRFRNANPLLFKTKYDLYKDNDSGMKIDLNKNFRSRYEVLDDINIIFNLIMDNYIGGANYIDSHNMIFGNETYINEGKTNQNNNLEIYNYLYDKELHFTKEEVEAFIIANDIKNKISNKYQIFDKDSLKLNDIKYSDIVILMDRSTNFDLYKKIFEYLNIPTTIYKDINIVNENELLIIKNIISFIIKIKRNELDTEFKYLFTSISRSYLISDKDNDILKCFNNNLFTNSKLYKLCYEISLEIDNISNVRLLDLIIDKFDIYNKLNLVGNIDNKTMIIDYLYDNFKDLDSIGYSIYDLKDYFDNITKKDKQIKISMNGTNGNSVKIMTIHKSKGLEFPICYFCGFDKSFNLSDLKERIIFDNTYGIITPFECEGLDNLITKEIIKNNYIREDISERIRLLYVALTRAKEKMIIVGEFNKDTSCYYNESIVDNSIRGKYKSFKDIILSIKDKLSKSFVDINLSKVNLSHDYNIIKDSNYENSINKTNDRINIKNISVDNELIINKHFSKNSKSIINKDIKHNMDFGIHLHELFEVTDFKNPNYELVSDSDKLYIERFLNKSIFDNIEDAKIYKEYEFIYDDESVNYHGIIDAMLEYEDYIDIIDYKLKNTDDDAYLDQLNGYKKYIENSFNKKVNLYLYSIMDNTLKKI